MIQFAKLDVSNIYIPTAIESLIPTNKFALVEVDQNGYAIVLAEETFDTWEDGESFFNSYQAKKSLNGAIVQRTITHTKILSVGYLD